MIWHTPHLRFGRSRRLYYPETLRKSTEYQDDPAWCFAWGFYYTDWQIRQHLIGLTKFPHT